MKYIIHVPSERYGYVEVHCDSLVEAKTEYDNVKKVFAGEKIDGMNKNEWSAFRRNFLIENKYELEELEKMSPLQKWWVHQTEQALQAIIKPVQGTRAESSHRQ
jgi:hypothetical protein